MNSNPWLLHQRTSSQAELRLFCLPYAGGGASVYGRWHQLVPETIEVCPIELPGRGLRLREEPFVRMAPLVRAMADALEPCLDRPYLLFGHSMGALIAFELVRLLRRRGGMPPRHLFVSAAASPGTPPLQPLVHQASDASILRRLQALDGTPQQILANKEVMALMVPILRADFAVLETYELRQEPLLNIPITVLGGAEDSEITLPKLEGWLNMTTAMSRLQIFPGGHFFLNKAAPEIIAAILKDIKSGKNVQDGETPSTEGNSN